VQGQLPVVPQRDSLRVADRTVAGVTESRADRFYTRRTAAQVDRVPFEEQRRGMEDIARRSFTGTTAGAGSTAVAASTPPEETGRGNRTEAEQSRGWRRIDQPTRSAPTVERSVERAPERADREGEWRRFGTPRTETSTVDSSPRGERSVRFGEPATSRSSFDATPQARPAVTRGSEENGWRRFGERSGEAATPAVSERRSEGSNEGWRRETSPRSEAPRIESPRYEGSRSESLRSVPRGERRSDGGDSVRISPPIVRDRGGRSSFNEGMRSAPRFDSGSMRGSDSGGSRGADRSAMRDGGGAPRGGNAAPSGGDGGGRGASRGGEGRSGRSGR
jgi:23S rRNA pseudouridine2605 synthase